MDAREKEQYLREYSILKNQGKPFFPYAVAKDSLMACLVLAVIITMSILFGAELGPKADPTTTTYTPRHEWYFFFLFEQLRVVKPPELVFLATIEKNAIVGDKLFIAALTGPTSTWNTLALPTDYSFLSLLTTRVSALSVQPRFS